MFERALRKERREAIKVGEVRGTKKTLEKLVRLGLIKLEDAEKLLPQ